MVGPCGLETIQEFLRHAKASTTLDLYSQAIDAAKLKAQEDIASLTYGTSDLNRAL